MHPFLKTMLHLGITALICSIIGAVCYPYSIGINRTIDTLSIFGLLVGLFLSLIVLFLVGCSFLYFLIRQKFKQVGFCIIPCLLPVLTAGIIMPAMGGISPKLHKEICNRHIQEISKALKQYTEHNDKVPVEWCDALVLDCELRIYDLRCGRARSTFSEGESSYAFNKYVVGLPKSELPPDIVMLFETDCVGVNPENKIPMRERKFVNENTLYMVDEEEVKEGAWNQVGDIDILTCSYHAGLGCNILFADGHVEFVKKKDIPNLRWTVEE